MQKQQGTSRLTQIIQPCYLCWNLSSQGIIEEMQINCGMVYQAKILEHEVASY
jgi:hypothetical protein